MGAVDIGSHPQAESRAMSDKSLDAGRISALEAALEWALIEIRILGMPQLKPDDPFWNDYRRSKVVLEGYDPKSRKP